MKLCKYIVLRSLSDPRASSRVIIFPESMLLETMARTVRGFSPVSGGFFYIGNNHKVTVTTVTHGRPPYISSPDDEKLISKLLGLE